MTDFSIDGPFSPEQTREAARKLAEGVRYLNHATHPGNDGGLESPTDAYDLLGELATAVQRLPQLASQVRGFLLARAARGDLGDDSGRIAEARIAQAGSSLLAAVTEAARLADTFGAAQQAVSGLYVKDGGGG